MINWRTLVCARVSPGHACSRISRSDIRIRRDLQKNQRSILKLEFGNNYGAQRKRNTDTSSIWVLNSWLDWFKWGLRVIELSRPLLDIGKCDEIQRCEIQIPDMIWLQKATLALPFDCWFLHPAKIRKSIPPLSFMTWIFAAYSWKSKMKSLRRPSTWSASIARSPCCSRLGVRASWGCSRWAHSSITKWLFSWSHAELQFEYHASRVDEYD